MSDDLIDPDAIPVPIVNTVLLESAASGIRTDGENIAEAGQDIKSSWAGLQEVYSAPEASELYAAVNPVATTGEGVETDFSTAATALETFAETARELRSQLVQARLDARDLVAEIQSDEDWDDGGFFGGESEKVQEHNTLLNHVSSLHQQYQEAERECANAITALFGGTTFIASNAEGTTQPGAGEAVYGFEEAPEDVQTPWGTPQGTDHMWHVDAVHGGWDVLKGSVEDMGGAVGAHGSEGWWDGGWWNNFSSYWGDSIEGLGAMTGFYNPQTGAMVDSPGEWWDTARGAWGDAVHGFFPWTELGERPGYVFGTVATNVGMIAGGALLSATGFGAVVGVPMIGARVSRILGGAGTGDGPISGDINADGSDGSDGSQNGSQSSGNNGNTPSVRLDGTHPDAPTAPDRIEFDGDDGFSGIGDMNDTLNDLEASQNQAPQPDPTPASDHSPDPTPDSTATPDSAPVDSGAPERSDDSNVTDREGTSSQDTNAQNTDTPDQRADEETRLDPTAEEADAAFAEIARRNEDVADDMDAVDDGQMAELDGSERWSMGVLEDPGAGGRGDGPGQGDDSPVLVTPDGMEVRADNNVNNSVDGDGLQLDDSSDPVTIHEDTEPRTSDPSPGGPPDPPKPPGPFGPDNGGSGGDGGNGNEGDGTAPPPEGPPDPLREKQLERASELETTLRQAGLTDEDITSFRGDNERHGRAWQRFAAAVDNNFPVKNKINERLQPEAIRFALEGAENPFEAAYRYEYYKAIYDQEARRIDVEMRPELPDGQKRKISNPAKLAAFRLFHEDGFDVHSSLDSDLRFVQDTRGEAVHVDLSAGNPELIDATRGNAGRIGMGPDLSAAYHARKHQFEVPLAERTGDPVRDYFDSAELTIRDGRVANIERLDGGGVHVTFEREIPGADIPEGEGEIKVMVAQVYIREHTGPVMATYGQSTRTV